MNRLSRQYRVLALVWAVLQFALPSVVTLVDAISTGRSAAEAVAHVEESSSTRCQPPHSAECALCRYVSATVATDASMAAGAWPLAEVAAPTHAVPVLRGTFASLLPPSRAPPVV